MTPGAAEAQPIEPGVSAPPKGQTSYKRLLVWLLPASTAMFALFNGLQSILLPQRIEAIDPANKVANLGLVTTVSAVAAVIGVVAGGAISDRTRGRWGKRTPSLVFGALTSAALVVALGQAHALVPVLWFASALWFCANYYQGAMTAILPDRVPLEHRGVGSSVMAMGIPLGVLVGVNLAAQAGEVVSYPAIAGLLVVTMVLLIVFAPEPPAYDSAPARDEPRLSPADRLAGFFRSFRSRDFTLAFFSRALMFFSIFCVTGYTYYILQDFVGAANLPGGNVQLAVSMMISIQMVACIASTAISGWLTDRFGRPKLFVAISSLGIAAAMFIPLFIATWPAMVVMQALVGLFFGSYMAIDLALMSLVLPDPDAEGRDMGILAVATSGSQMLSPVAAAVVIAQFGYAAMFGSAAVVAILGGIGVMCIRSVR